MNKTLYVAYGSNLNLGQMAYRCPTAEVFGRGVIDNYELVFNRVASIERKDGAKVPVAVWSIDDECEKSLDRYEGFPWMYRKEDIEVVMEDGRKVKGLVYIMNDDRRELPTQSYYDVIANGYEDVGLDRKYLRNAVERCYKEVSA